MDGGATLHMSAGTRGIPELRAHCRRRQEVRSIWAVRCGSCCDLVFGKHAFDVLLTDIVTPACADQSSPAAWHKVHLEIQGIYNSG
jgi:hypothetical protein